MEKAAPVCFGFPVEKQADKKKHAFKIQYVRHIIKKCRLCDDTFLND